MVKSINRKVIVNACAFLVVCVSVAVLLGWWSNVGWLKSGVPGFPEMVPNTALAFLFCGIVLAFLGLDSGGKAFSLIITVLSLAIFAIAVITLGAYLFGYNSGLDTIFLPSGDLTAPSGFIGRMAPHSTVGFLLLASAFLTLNFKEKSSKIGEVFTIACVVVATSVLLGYLYGAARLYGIPNVNSMAIHAAVLFLICCLGLFAINANVPVVKMLTNSGPGGVTARWFAAAVIILPTLVDQIRLKGEQFGAYDRGFGAALSQLVRIVIMCAFVFYVSTRIYRLDKRRINAESELAEKERRYRALFESGQSNICIHDVDGVLLNVNPAAFRSLGYEVDELVGHRLEEFLTEDIRPLFPAFLRQIVNEGQAEGAFSLLSKAGKRVVWQYQSILVTEPDGETYVLGNAQDITKLSEVKEELKNLSLTDELTGLSNRRGFEALAEQQIKLERHTGTARGLTLMFADLDGLKAINDKYGHHAGSDAIIAFANVLRSALRDADLMARWGGDEFVVLTIGTSGETSDMVLERIHTMIDKHNAESDAPYDLACSIGTTPVSFDSKVSFAEYIERADQAMYAEKRRRKGTRD